MIKDETTPALPLNPPLPTELWYLILEMCKYSWPKLRVISMGFDAFFGHRLFKSLRPRDVPLKRLTNEMATSKALRSMVAALDVDHLMDILRFGAIPDTSTGKCRLSPAYPELGMESVSFREDLMSTNKKLSKSDSEKVIERLFDLHRSRDIDDLFLMFSDPMLWDMLDMRALVTVHGWKSRFRSEFQRHLDSPTYLMMCSRIWNMMCCWEKGRHREFFALSVAMFEDPLDPDWNDGNICTAGRLLERPCCLKHITREDDVLPMPEQKKNIARYILNEFVEKKEMDSFKKRFLGHKDYPFAVFYLRFVDPFECLRSVILPAISGQPLLPDEKKGIVNFSDLHRMLHTVFEELCHLEGISPVPQKRTKGFRMIQGKYVIARDMTIHYPGGRLIRIEPPTILDHLVSVAALDRYPNAIRRLCDFDELLVLFWLNHGFFYDQGSVMMRNIIDALEFGPGPHGPPRYCDSVPKCAFWIIMGMLHSERFCCRCEITVLDVFEMLHPGQKGLLSDQECVRILAINFMEVALIHENKRSVCFQKQWDSIKDTLC